MAVDIREKLKNLAFSGRENVYSPQIRVANTFIARVTRDLAQGQIPAGAEVIVQTSSSMKEEGKCFYLRYYPNEECEVTTLIDDEAAIDYVAAYVEARREILANISTSDLLQEAYDRENRLKKAEAICKQVTDGMVGAQMAGDSAKEDVPQGGIPIPTEIADHLKHLNYIVLETKTVETGRGTVRIVTTISSYRDEKEGEK